MGARQSSEEISFIIILSGLAFWYSMSDCHLQDSRWEIYCIQGNYSFLIRITFMLEQYLELCFAWRKLILVFPNLGTSIRFCIKITSFRLWCRMCIIFAISQFGTNHVGINLPELLWKTQLVQFHGSAYRKQRIVAEAGILVPSILHMLVILCLHKFCGKQSNEIGPFFLKSKCQ